MRPAAEINKIMAVFQQEDATPPSELEYTNAYTLLIAIALSAQSTDKSVNKATKELFKIADTPQKMLTLGIEQLKEHIRTIGLYNTKAKNIMALSERLVSEHHGEVPQTREELTKLPGIGRKTANVFLNVWYHKPTIAVDTHVLRIAKRLNLSDGGNDPLKVEQDLDNVLAEEYKFYVNHWLVLFGRYICKAQKPDCNKCPVSKFCQCADKKIS